MVQVTDPRTGALLDPQQARQTPPTGAPTTDTGGGTDLGSQWNDWIGRPSNRAALMQFGIAMLQPVGVGQSQIGNMANAVGEAGEAAQRVSTEEMGRQREASQEEYRGQQANLAEQKAAQQGALTDVKRGALENQAERLRQAGEMTDIKKQNVELTNMMRIIGLQNQAKQRYEAEVLNNVMIPQAKKPSFRDWVAQDPQYAELLGRSTTMAPGATPAAQPQEGLGTPSPAAPMPVAKQVMIDPKYRDLWNATKEMARSNDPALRSGAQQRADALARVVSDPENIYRELGLKPPERR